jgi:dTDP-4-amino-4,6-dideoxygalactose transaminase
MNVLPYSRQLVDEEDISAVLGVLRGDWLTQGPTVAAFESASPRPVGPPRGWPFQVERRLSMPRLRWPG